MKRKFKNFIRHLSLDLVIRYMFMYLLVLSIILVPFVLLFNQIFERNEDNIITLNRDNMQTTVDVMGNLITRLDKLAIGMNLDVDIMNYIYVKEAFVGRGVHATLDTASYIKAYDQNTDPSIMEIFVYYTASDMLISANKVYNLGQIIDVGTLEIEGLNKYQWSNLIDSGYKGRQIYGTYDMHLYDKSSFKGLVYTNTLGHPGKNYAKLVVLIDVGFLDEYLMNFVKEKGGMYLVINDEGHVLLKGGEVLDYKQRYEKQFITTELMSEEFGWTFVTILPRKQLVQDMTIFKNRAFFIIGVSLIAVFILSFYLAKSNARPILEFSRLMGGHTDDRNEFEFIKNSINDLFTNYDKVHDESSQNHEMVKRLFFSQLIDEGFRNKEEMISYRETLGKVIEYDNYAAGIIHLIPKTYHGEGDVIQTGFAEKTILSSMLNEGFDHIVCLLGQKSFDRIIIVFGFKENAETAGDILDKYASRLRNRSEILMGSSVYVTMGIVVQALESLPYSYYMGRKKMELLVWNGNDPASISKEEVDEINRGTPFLIFNSTTLRKITTYIRSGNIEEARRILDDMLYKNIVAENLDRSVMILKINEIVIAVVELMEELRMGKEEIISFTRAMEKAQFRVKNIQVLLGDQLEKICLLVNEKKRSHNNILFYQINRYVQDNALDSQLSLQSVADKFGISDVYLSTFFKEQRGMNFFDYVEMERIEHAKGELKQTNRSVTSIAGECGYNSSNTFSKAFRRRTGMNATDYRIVSRE